MGRRGAVRRGLASVVCVGLSACSPLLPLPPLPPGKELAITLPDRPAPQPGVRVEGPGGPDTSHEAPVIAGGGAMGVSAGLAASTACGLAIFICAPIFMVVGGVAGGAGMAALADAGRPPVDDPIARALNDLERRLAAFARTSPLNEQLRLVLVDRASAHWQIVPASTRSSMTVELTGFGLRAESAERIYLEVRAGVVVTSEDFYYSPLLASRDPQVGNTLKQTSGSGVMSATFRYEGPPADVGQWMDESGDFLKTAVDRALDELARQIVTSLAPRAAS